MASSPTEIARYCDQLLLVDQFKDYCPNGLQVEGGESVSRIVSGVTACQALIDAAVEGGADLLLVHHGFFWRGEPEPIVGIKRRRIKALLDAGISLLAYHLPLDAHPELGNNAQFGKLIGAEVDRGFDRQMETSVGLVGHFERALTGTELADRLRSALGRAPLHIKGSDQPIQTVAWCTGGAQGFIDKAMSFGVDAYISGEISEPTVHAAREGGIHYFEAGHHATERGGPQALGAHLAEKFSLEHRFIDIPNPV